MRKIGTAFLLLALAFLVYAYAAIPSLLTITKMQRIAAPEQSVYRYLNDTSLWKKWWPALAQTNNLKPVYTYQQVQHQPTEKIFNGVALSANVAGEIFSGRIFTATNTKDSITIFWEYQHSLNLNPFARVNTYLKARQLKKNISRIMDALTSFLENKDLVYGMRIVETNVMDTVLISIRKPFNHLPSLKELYQEIEVLESTILTLKMKQTNAPRYFVSAIDSNTYQTQFAIPVEAITEPLQPPVEFRRMIAGRILVAEVKGPETLVQQAFKQMRNYVSDFNITSPAIPFYALITDRRKELDSTKWVTRIYYPMLEY